VAPTPRLRRSGLSGFFLADEQHAFFDDMMHSPGRGVMYAFAFKVRHALAMPGAIVLVLVVLAVAVLVSRR
jgi:hypothetical protein